jgi:hypothetical protein
MNIRMKTIAISLAAPLLCSMAFAQGREDLKASALSSVQVGRSRGVIEDSLRLPGQHNLVHMVQQRRIPGVCSDTQAAAESLLTTDPTAQINQAPVGWDVWYKAVAEQGERLRFDMLATATLPGAPQFHSDCWTRVKDEWSYNLVTNAGLNWLADIMSNTSTPSVNAQCNYIGLSNGAGTPAAGDTALATTVGTEISSNGLSRAQATYAHTSNATTYTLAKTFTATGTQAAQAGAVFTASSAGTMCFEDTFTQASLVSGDTLTVTWTITI